MITVIAGNRQKGFSGDGGPAKLAQLNGPEDITADDFGNIYIADTNNQRIRKINPNGIITTLAGNGQSGFSGDGGPATAAKLKSPRGVAVDKRGYVYVADTGNYRYAGSAPTGSLPPSPGTDNTDFPATAGRPFQPSSRSRAAWP